WLMLRPVSQEKLYKSIEKLMRSDDPKMWTRANEGPVRDYLRRFGGQDDEHTKQVRLWSEQVGIMEAEKELTSAVAAAKKIDISKMDALSETGRKAVKA